MHRQKQTSAGFAILELVLVVAVLAAAGLTAWWVYERQPNAANSSAARASNLNVSPFAKNVSSAPKIQSSSDLDKALQTLDQNDPAASNSSDSAQLSSEASGF